MEIRQQIAQLSNSAPFITEQSNDNRIPGPVTGRSMFPQDAIAYIYRPSRSVMTSAPARKHWQLEFEQRHPSYIEPLMGYTGCDDTLKQVRLRFDTKEAAIRYAQRQGLDYVVRASNEPQTWARSRDVDAKRVFSDETLDRLGLLALADSYGYRFTETRERHLNKYCHNLPYALCISSVC